MSAVTGTNGSLYELDVRPIQRNLLATLSRRPEAYHDKILRHAQGHHHGGHEKVVLKQTGLDRALHYDPYPRKALIDHFYEPDVRLEDLAATREAELGDFVTAPYESRVRRGAQLEPHAAAELRASQMIPGANVARRHAIMLGDARQRLTTMHGHHHAPGGLGLALE